MANRTVTDMAKYREQMLENAGGLGVTFDLAWTDKLTGEQKSEQFVVPHPMIASPKLNEALEKIPKNDDGRARARVMLETDSTEGAFDRFLAAGGTESDVLMAWQAMMAEMQRNGFRLPDADV